MIFTYYLLIAGKLAKSIFSVKNSERHLYVAE